jgi:putative peptide zinc metalloprotease protein
LSTLKLAATAVALLLFGLLPVWPDFVHAPVMLESPQRALLRASIPGKVVGVYAQEGQHVASGVPLVRLQNLALESEAAQAQAALAAAEARATQASMNYTAYAAADQERRQLAEKERALRDKLGQLEILSPIAGVVVTEHAGDLIGSSVADGDAMLEVADTAQIRARIYIPEFAMHDIHAGAPVRLRLGGQFTKFSSTISSVSPTVTAIAEGLVSKAQLQGINPPRYYAAAVMLDNNGSLREGMTGSAKILVRHDSLVGRFWRFLAELLGRKFW